MHKDLIIKNSQPNTSALLLANSYILKLTIYINLYLPHGIPCFFFYTTSHFLSMSGWQFFWYSKWVLKVVWWTRNETSSSLRKLFIRFLFFLNPSISFYCCDKIHVQNYLGQKKDLFWLLYSDHYMGEGVDEQLTSW